MKYLSEYTQDAQTALFNKTGAFFAFSKAQFEEGRSADLNVKYASLGSGMICPSANCAALVDGLDKIQAAGIKADIAENGKSAIIQRELGNHEAQITMDMSDTLAAVAQYGYTEDDVKAAWPAFFQNCIDNDYL